MHQGNHLPKLGPFMRKTCCTKRNTFFFLKQTKIAPGEVNNKPVFLRHHFALSKREQPTTPQLAQQRWGEMRNGKIRTQWVAPTPAPPARRLCFLQTPDQDFVICSGSWSLWTYCPGNLLPSTARAPCTAPHAVSHIQSYRNIPVLVFPKEKTRVSLPGMVLKGQNSPANTLLMLVK